MDYFNNGLIDEDLLIKMKSGQMVSIPGACGASNTQTTDIQNTNIQIDADTEAPVIMLNGNNPAEAPIGSEYHDLGVIVTDNIDQNLGFSVWRDGVELGRNLSGVSVDTSAAGERAISYVATDQAGNTATSTRTVVIFDPYADVVSINNATSTNTNI